MARLLLVMTGLFLLPFAVFAAYLAFSRGRLTVKDLIEGPVVWLAAVGVLLVLAGFAVFGSLERMPAREGIYVPPSYEDGVLVPGHIEPRREERQ